MVKKKEGYTELTSEDIGSLDLSEIVHGSILEGWEAARLRKAARLEVQKPFNHAEEAKAMARRGRAGNRQQRLEVLGFYLKDIYGTGKSYPTVTQLARKLGVTTPTVYRDLEKLRDKLGSHIVPKDIKLGGKKDVSEG